MPDAASTPNLEALTRGFMPARILMAGVEVGVFDALAQAERTAPELTAELDADARGLRILLDALTALALLNKTGDRYSLTAAARESLVTDSPHSMVNIIMHMRLMWDAWGRLDSAVRTGQPLARTQGNDAALDALRTRSFILGMAEAGANGAQALADYLDLKKVRTVLDVGGGPGTYCIALAQRHSTLRGTLLDREAPLAIARERIEAVGLLDRIALRPGDALTDGYGGPYDVVVVSQLLHAYGPDDNAKIVRRAAEALAPGGLLTVHEFALKENKVAPASAALFAVNMLVNTEAGQTYTEDEIMGWMQEAGLAALHHEDLTGRSRFFFGTRP